ncbi:hypothetical protein LOTGIDRAFT_116217, partial [Lottia gigantea]
GTVPAEWTKSLIHPIFKPGSDDKLVPSNYRGISLISVTSKIYCHILNSRVNKWLGQNNSLSDFQNSFRKNLFRAVQTIYFRYITL